MPQIGMFNVARERTRLLDLCCGRRCVPACRSGRESAV